jgi:hypothetical protein
MLGCFVQRDRLASESFNRSIEKKTTERVLGRLGTGSALEQCPS